MKTSEFINAVAQDAGARSPSIGWQTGAALGVGCLVAGTLLLATLGVRPDIAWALRTWRFDVKLATTALTALAALGAAWELVKPAANVGRAAALLFIPVLALLFAVAAELWASPSETWGARAIGANSRLCLVAILAYAAGPLAALLVGLREGAPPSPPLAGAAAGLVAGSIGALFYALHCPDDSPLFVALWYVPPILLMGVAGAIIGRRSLRW